MLRYSYPFDLQPALDGWSTVDELIQATIDLDYPSLSLTDHGLCSGHLELGTKCEKAGLKPIFGQEGYHGELTTFKGSQRDQAHLIVGAYNDNGLKNLWRLSDKAASNFRFVPRVNWDMLKEFREGLWATSACVQGLVAQGIKNDDLSALNQYLDIFGEDFFIEIHTYPTEDQRVLNQALVLVAREKGIPLIWSSDSHFAKKEDYLDHDKYMIMQMGEKIDTPIEERKMWHPEALYIKSEAEIRSDLAYLGASVVDECIRNSFELSEKCDARLPEVRRHLPVFIPRDSKIVPEKYQDEGAADLLARLVIDGAFDRYENPSQEVWDRLSMELDVFLKAGLEDYILQAWEICKFCDESGIIRGPGRGSSAGSLICYVLRITDIDSLHYGLYFERFYNAGREKGLPDIDIDFPVSAREKVKAFVAKRWGQEYVENIGTVMRLKPIAALNKTWNAFLVDPKEFAAIRKIVGKTHNIEILGADSIGWANDGSGTKTVYVLDDVGDEIEEYISELPRARQEIVHHWLDFVGRLVGRVSGYGIHPSGLVISDVPVNEELPRMWSASSKAFATQFPMDDVGKRQFLKDDLLGLRNLDTLEDWERQMGAKGVAINWSGLERKDHPDEMWEMLENRLGIGIFQIEDSSFPLELCRRMKPRSIEDLALIVALNRPGPKLSGSPERYIGRRYGNEPVVYDDTFLEDILQPTLGEWIYQESVIALFSKLGYSLQEADAVRSLLGKKDPEEQKRLYEGKGQWKGKGYLQKAQEAGLGNAQRIWDKIAGFSLYSFNRPHAISYAFIAFRTLFAKYWGPEEFILACIRTNPEDKHKYIAEGRRLGVKIGPPHIAHSEIQISLKESGIYMGFSEVKGLSPSSARYLVHLRTKYGAQVYNPDILKQKLELENEVWFNTNKDFRSKVSPKTTLKMSQIDLLIEVGAFDEYINRPVTDNQRRSIEKEKLGIIITQNTAEVFSRNQEKLQDCDTYSDLEEKGEVMLPGAIAEIKLTQTRTNGEDMAIVTIEYGPDNCQFAVFPRQFRTHKYLFNEGTCAIIQIRATERGNQFIAGHKLV